MATEDLEPEKYHDIMNSVSVISSAAELLLEDEEEPLKKDLLSRIKARAEKIAELVPPR